VPSDISDETEKLKQISEALAVAVLRSDEIDDESARMLSELKLEKLIYYALKSEDELDQVTNSWYIAGAKTETDFGGTNTFDTIYEEVISPATASESSSEFRDPRRTHAIETQTERYVEFFTRDFDLEDVWFKQGEVFLLEFYKEEAPPEYRALYVAVQELRNYLNQIKRALENIVSVQATQSSSLAEYGQKNIITGPNRYDDITNTVSKIHLELGKHEKLKQTLPHVRRFTDLVEDASLALSKMQVERVDDSVIQTFQQMRQKFYYNIWRLPSILISINTARGPRSDELQSQRTKEFEDAKDQLESVLESLENQCSDASLIPTKADYPSYSKDDETIDDLLGMYATSR